MEGREVFPGLTSRSGSVSLPSGGGRNDLEDASRSLAGSRYGQAGLGRKMRLLGIPRRTLGLSLLMITVVAWTSSNFLASNIFADDTYSKPFFVTYVNTSFFAVTMIPIILRKIQVDGRRSFLRQFSTLWEARGRKYSVLSMKDDDLPSPDGPEEHLEGPRNQSASQVLLVQDEMGNSQISERGRRSPSKEPLTLRETVMLSGEFCLLWFLANYFVAACLRYTTVASTTILSSTSGIWTLLFGVPTRVETFTVKKLVGVLASLAGIFLISRVDLSGSMDDNRGSFPHKTTKELALGDAMAIFSAILYGAYAVLMKKRIGNEERINMPLFFGLVGLFNVVFLWPGFIILHFLGSEPFELPPTGRIWAVVLINSTTSFFSDYCWIYAVLLTSPLVVTVGLGLTIPLSLIGQMIIASQYSSPLYWTGAVVVVLSFILISYEDRREEAQELDASSSSSSLLSSTSASAAV